jgi:hypothetical protein
LWAGVKFVSESGHYYEFTRKSAKIRNAPFHNAMLFKRRCGNFKSSSKQWTIAVVSK